VGSRMCENLIPFADGQLSPKSRAEFTAHLANCPKCEKDLLFEMQISAMVDSAKQAQSRNRARPDRDVLAAQVRDFFDAIRATYPFTVWEALATIPREIVTLDPGGISRVRDAERQLRMTVGRADPLEAALARVGIDHVPSEHWQDDVRTRIESRSRWARFWNWMAFWR